MLERKNQGRSRLKLFVFLVVGIHVVGLSVLLMQGCKREDSPPPYTPPVPLQDTNPPVTPTFEPTNTTPVTPVTPVVTPTTPTPPVTPVTPPVTPVTPPVVPGEARQHTVEKNDSFYTLSKKYGVSMKAIETANPGVDSKKLKIGQKLNIPAPTAAPAPTPTTPTSGTVTDTSDAIYVVKSGDTLTSIAKHAGTTPKALKAENKLTTDRIMVGQKLKVPAKSATPPSAPESTPAASLPGTTPPPVSPTPGR